MSVLHYNRVTFSHDLIAQVIIAQPNVRSAMFLRGGRRVHIVSRKGHVLTYIKENQTKKAEFHN